MFFISCKISALSQPRSRVYLSIKVYNEFVSKTVNKITSNKVVASLKDDSFLGKMLKNTEKIICKGDCNAWSH